MKLNIRNASLRDSEFITGLSYQLGYKTTTENIQERLTEIITNQDHCFYVVEDNEIVIGWIHAFKTLRVESESSVEIGGMVVKENYRSKGIGKALIEKIIEWSLNKGLFRMRVRCNSVRLETHKFYEKLGFIEIKEQRIFDKKIS